MNEIPQRLAEVRRRIRAAAEAAGRQAEEIALLAVSKTKPAADIVAAYREGQRRFLETLSAYARQFLSMMEKPDVDHIEGLSPAISIGAPVFGVAAEFSLAGKD